MDTKGSRYILISYSIFLCGVLLFLYGFFPICIHGDEAIASEDDLPTKLGNIQLDRNSYSSRTLKMALMIVDAMRYDFFTDQSSNMPYMHEQISTNEACLLKVRVETPTVTLPRIKSLTTGTISNFIDIVLNFGSTELNSDSIIHQMQKRKRNVIVFGDNTWTNVFPGKFHKEFTNNDSFFVQDFYQGDKKITDEVKLVLNTKDWNFLVMHYLGLDHIGHVEGPFSKRIPLKLREMDDAVEHLHLTLTEKNEPYLLVVTADHGMRDTGGHGGSSEPEMVVPFLTFHSSCNSAREKTYNQLDIASTLSVLLGIPIPTTSIGCIIPELISHLPLLDQLFALHYNNKRLVQKASSHTGELSGFSMFFEKGLKAHEAFLRQSANNTASFLLYHEAKVNYLESTKQLSELLSAELVNFDVLAIGLGIILATMGTILVAFGVFCERIYLDTTRNCWFILATSLMTGKVVLESLCNSLFETSQICKFSIIGCIPISLIIFILIVGYVKNIPYRAKMFYKKAPFELLLVVIHAISLPSSSFVEEEHQTWYYLITTLLLLLGLRQLYSGMLQNSTLNIGMMSQWVLIISAHVFLRRLNQTGDKWLHLPDIGDWLNAEEHSVQLSLFSALGLLLALRTLADFSGKIENALNVVVIISIFWYRITTGLGFVYNLENPKIPLYIFWTCITLTLVRNYSQIIFLSATGSKRKSHLQNWRAVLNTTIIIFVLISLLLQKPHNIVLVPACIVTAKAAFANCNGKSWTEAETLTYKVIMSIGIGKLFFFYQGNSNSLASVDLNAGFVGMDEYNFCIAAILIMLNTYFGPLCCFLLLLHDSAVQKDRKNEENMAQQLLLLALCVIFSTNMYLFLMVILRSHLFIWSVFSPKLLYEVFSCSLYYLLLLFSLISYRLIKLM